MNLNCDDMCAATTGSLFRRTGQVAALLLACVRKVGRVVSLALACVTVLPSFAAENAYMFLCRRTKARSSAAAVCFL